MTSRSFRSLAASALVVLTLLGARLPAQDLLPLEQQALRARAAGDATAAAAAFLGQGAQVAATATATAGDELAAARVEAWATAAARLLTGRLDAAMLARFDALRSTPLANAHPLLRDRLGIAALEAAERKPPADGQARAAELGFVREVWLIGPFANERGAGFRETLGPEGKFDLDAEYPGKRRPVVWRQLPARPFSPVLPLARIVDPPEQSLVYVAAAVIAETPATAVLELGSTGSVRVFCNGAEVFARDVERACQFDQDVAVLPLAAGGNLLVVKLCHQEGAEFAAALRLRALDGGRLPGVRTSAARDDLVKAAATAAVVPSAEAPKVPLGARSTWTIGEAGGADALRLCWVWRARAADGDRDRRDAAAAAAAVAQLPDTAEAHVALAAAMIRHGRSAADRDENDRRRALEAALAADPANVDAMVHLGWLLRDGSGLWREARRHADHALAGGTPFFGALLLRDATLRDERLPELADAELLAAAARDDAAPELLRRAADLIADREPKLALALRRRVCVWSSGEADQVALATALARTGAAAEAIGLLRDTIAADPFVPRPRQQLVELLLAGDDVAGALAVLDDWLRIAPDDANAMVQAGRCLRRLRGDDDSAAARQLELLRAALRIEPNRRDDERYAEFVAGDVAGGSAADANVFYAAHRVDAATVLKDDAGPPADAAAARDPVHWVLRQEVVRANANGTTSVYRHDIVRLLTAEGARRFQSWTVPHYQGEQRARLLGCTIWRADGSVQRPALQGARVRLPDLRPGDAIAVEGRVDDLAPTFFGDYFGHVHTFAAHDGSPVRTDELIVLCAPGREYHDQSVQGAPVPERTTAADGTLQLRWRMTDLPRDVPEVRRPDQKERLPTARVTTYRDWDQFASWWWSLIKNQLEVTPAMRATVERLCKGLATTEAKIAAIYHFVTTDVRYEAWEFGVHGYKPYATSIIHERRHGDCKDKALLLCALLGEIGVSCQPVLIFAEPLRSNDDLTLPMVQHFNHCIAWLPPAGNAPGRFLDGTAVWHATDTLPDMDQGADVLIVDRGRAELRTVPWTTPDANVDRTEHIVELLPDGSARLHRTMRPAGNSAVELRAMLATEPARRHEVVERELVRTFGKATLSKLDATAPQDPEAPVQLSIDASLPEVGQRSNGEWQLPSSWEQSDPLALISEQQRQTPLLLGVPVGTERSLRYRLPAGWRARELPEPVTRDAKFGRFSMHWRADGDTIVVERRLAITVPRVPIDDYGAFREFVAAVKAADAQLVLLQKERGR